MESTPLYQVFTFEAISTLLAEIWEEIIFQRDSIPSLSLAEEPQRAALPRTIGDIRDIYGDLMQIEAC